MKFSIDKFDKSENRSPFFISLFTLSFFIALIIAGLMHLTPPIAATESTEKNLFSSKRAMASLQEIAKQPHPIGSPENALVRRYLVEYLESLGLQPRLQKTLAVSRSKGWNSAGFIENVLVRIPGDYSSRALMIVAHYDSTPGGPGAADNGASVAAVLETIRALSHTPSLLNDVVFLFTDGEETGLLGAEAFVSEHPWVPDIGLVLNFEYRGNQGPHLMFETSMHNGELIESFAEKTSAPLGSSLMYDIYRYLPNDTDFSIFKRAGMRGMNFSTVDGYLSYHSPRDNVELLDEASLQHQGEIMLELVKHFGSTDLNNIESNDKIYFDFPGLGLINYPESYALIFFGIAFLALVLMFFLTQKRENLSFIKVTCGIVIFAFLIAFFSGGCQLFWLGITYFHADYHRSLIGDTYNSHWYLFAFSALVLASFIFTMRLLRSWFTDFQLSLSAIACWAIALLISSLISPGASYVFAWPLISILLVSTIIYWPRRKQIPSNLSILLLLIGLVPGVLLFVPLIKLLYVTLTPQMIWVPMVFLVFLMVLCVSLTQFFPHRSLVPELLLATAGILFTVGSITSEFDTENPKPNNVVYAYDSSLGNYYWISLDYKLDEYTKTFFTEPLYQPLPGIFGNQSPHLWVSSATPSAIFAPIVTVKENQLSDGERAITFHVISKRNANKIRLSINGTNVLKAAIEGKEAPIYNASKWSLNIYAPPSEGVNIELTIKAESSFTLLATDQTSGVPEHLSTRRPANMIPLPKIGDFTLAVSRVEIHPLDGEKRGYQ